MTKSTTRETADIAGVVGKNAIINGNFDIWQRALSQTATGYGSADRWFNIINGSTQVVSRQAFALGQTDVPNNPKYYSRTVVTSVAGVSNYAIKIQKIEGVETFAGTTATLSFWAKADASKNIAVEFAQSFGTGGTNPAPSANVLGIGVTTVALTTSWVKHTVSVAIPSISGKTLGTNGNDYFQLLLWMDAGSTHNARTNSLGQQSGTFEFSQVQIEAGSVATEFEPRSVGEELDLCERYYETGDGNFWIYAASGSQPIWNMQFTTTKRAVPTIVMVKGGNNSFPNAATGYASTSTIKLGCGAKTGSGAANVLLTFKASAEL
tara:strand:+ start:1988 stop:2953 length:966 start_codon:yes stop_codon:yes gene_type:complete